MCERGCMLAAGCVVQEMARLPRVCPAGGSSPAAERAEWGGVLTAAGCAILEAAQLPRVCRAGGISTAAGCAGPEGSQRPRSALGRRGLNGRGVRWAGGVSTAAGCAVLEVARLQRVCRQEGSRPQRSVLSGRGLDSSGMRCAGGGSTAARVLAEGAGEVLAVGAEGVARGVNGGRPKWHGGEGNIRRNGVSAGCAGGACCALCDGAAEVCRGAVYGARASARKKVARNKC